MSATDTKCIHCGAELAEQAMHPRDAICDPCLDRVIGGRRDSAEITRTELGAWLERSQSASGLDFGSALEGVRALVPECIPDMVLHEMRAHAAQLRAAADAARRVASDIDVEAGRMEVYAEIAFGLPPRPDKGGAA